MSKKSLQQIIQEHDHLTRKQHQALYECIQLYSTLFHDKLCKFKKYQIKIKLKSTAQPKNAHAYLMQHTHLDKCKSRLEKLISQGVLEPAQLSKWLSGSFIIPKKDASTHWITDPRHLNQSIHIEVLHKQTCYTFATLLDCSDRYYSFIIEPSSCHCMTMVTPFGLYQYAHLPQGISIGPNVVQETMENLLQHLKKWITCHFYNLTIFSDTWNKHINISDKVCKLFHNTVSKSTKINVIGLSRQ